MEPFARVDFGAVSENSWRGVVVLGLLPGAAPITTPGGSTDANDDAPNGRTRASLATSTVSSRLELPMSSSRDRLPASKGPSKARVSCPDDSEESLGASRAGNGTEDAGPPIAAPG